MNLFKHTLPRFGIETTFVNPRKPEEFRQAIRPETRLCFGEIIGNPGLEILDVPSVAEIAHAAGIPLMIDATFNTPYLCKPLELGTDLVSHSVTKWMGGHGVALGGMWWKADALTGKRMGNSPLSQSLMMVIMELIFTKNLDRRLFPCACDQRQCVTLVRP